MRDKLAETDHNGSVAIREHSILIPSSLGDLPDLLRGLDTSVEGAEQILERGIGVLLPCHPFTTSWLAAWKIYRRGRQGKSAVPRKYTDESEGHVVGVQEALIWARKITQDMGDGADENASRMAHIILQLELYREVTMGAITLNPSWCHARASCRSRKVTMNIVAGSHDSSRPALCPRCSSQVTLSPSILSSPDAAPLPMVSLNHRALAGSISLPCTSPRSSTGGRRQLPAPWMGQTILAVCRRRAQFAWQR